MALSLTPDTYGGTNYTIDARAGDNFKIITGSWSSPSTYVAGGISANLSSLGFLSATGQILYADFVCFQQPVRYSYSNDTILFYQTSLTSDAVYDEIADDSEITTSGGYFVVMGYGPM